MLNAVKFAHFLWGLNRDNVLINSISQISDTRGKVSKSYIAVLIDLS